MVAERRRSRGVHPVRISAKQRVHLAVVLTLIFALPLAAQGEIEFDPDITQEEFATFSRIVAQGIYATPVDSARARGLLGFDIGIAATAMPVDSDASYWENAISDDFTVSDHIVLPRIVATKGLSVATISASYAQVPGTDIAVWGGALDVPIVSGGVVTPTLAVRGAYATVQGVDALDLDTYGVELFLSKGFGPVTPYAAAGIAWSDSAGTIVMPDASEVRLTDKSDSSRITLGLKLSLLIPKIIVEATQAEERSYAAKLSFGF